MFNACETIISKSWNADSNMPRHYRQEFTQAVGTVGDPGSEG